MATWQKLIFSGSNTSELNNDSQFTDLSAILGVTQSLSSSMSDARDGLEGEINTLSGSLSTARDAVAADVTGSYGSLSSSLSTRVTSQENFSSSLDETFLTDEELNQGTGSILNNASASLNVITLTKGDGTTFDVEVVQSGVDTTTASFAQTAPWTGVQNPPADLASGSTFSSPSQGTLTAGLNGVTSNIDLGVQTGDSPTFAGLTTTGNAQIGGDLKVDGSTTTIGSETASLADKFVTFASGSTTANDGGIVISQQSNGTGEALGYDSSEDIWGFEGNFNPENTGIGPDAYVNLVTVSSSAPGTSDPAYGGANTKAGQFWVDTSTNFIWISQPDLIYQDTHYLTGWSNTNYLDMGVILGGFITTGSDWSFGYRTANTLPTNGNELTTFSTDNGAVAIELDSASQWYSYMYSSTNDGDANSFTTEPTQTSPAYWLWRYQQSDGRLQIYYNGSLIDNGTGADGALPGTTSGNVAFGKAISTSGVAREPFASGTGVSALYFANAYLDSSLNTTAYNNNGDITGDANYGDVDYFINVNATTVVDIKDGTTPSIEGSLTFTAK
jgi:hypothetical protein